MYATSITILLGTLLSIGSLAQSLNSVGMNLVSMPAGSFRMGSARGGKDRDEQPVHRVTITTGFRMAATEVTNAQYEAFDPVHKRLRGKNGFSTADDEAVVFVSYRQATAFCEWLTKKEGKPYRLPTEAEWEYACRAGTTGDFWTGNTLPAAQQKSQTTSRTPVVVPLNVARSPANPWGLYDMHGNVEEWCLDWYGPYQSGTQSDPVGRAAGLYRVSRGGSQGTPVTFLRSANRMASLPDDASWLVGFRVVQAPLPATKPLPPVAALTWPTPIRQQAARWPKPADTRPMFMEPQRYVYPPDSTRGVPRSVAFYSHNHQPAITWCPNGDLLTTWFSTDEESGREMTVLASRLRPGARRWDEPTEFFKVPDRNMTGASLLHDGKGTIYHLNGIETDGDWQDLAMALRTSTDNGATWTVPRLVKPEHGRGHQVIAGLSQTREGWLIQPADADAGPSGGTVVHFSCDRGRTWTTPSEGQPTPTFAAGKTGSLVAGIHAGVVQLTNGDLLALGRNDNLPATNGTGPRMPLSRSTDGGRTWTYEPSPFLPIGGGQRLVLARLREGPLLLLSFTHHPDERDSTRTGAFFSTADGQVYKGFGLFAALSVDEGKTWPVRKLLTDGNERQLNGGAWTGTFRMDATHAEPRGYLALAQTPDKVIHLLSSNLHYRFNLAWIRQLPPIPASKIP